MFFFKEREKGREPKIFRSCCFRKRI